MHYYIVLKTVYLFLISRQQSRSELVSSNHKFRSEWNFWFGKLKFDASSVFILEQMKFWCLPALRLCRYEVLQYRRTVIDIDVFIFLAYCIYFYIHIHLATTGNLSVSELCSGLNRSSYTIQWNVPIVSSDMREKWRRFKLTILLNHVIYTPNAISIIIPCRLKLIILLLKQ